MAKSTSGDRDRMEGVCDILAMLLFYLLSTARQLLSCLQGGQTTSPRGRGVPGYPLVGDNDGDGNWKDFDEAFAMPCAFGDLRIPPNIDPEGQYNVPLVDQPPAIQEPMQNIDADNVAAAEADLDVLLAVAEVASLPRQIERDEANMRVTPSSVAESGVTPSSLVDDFAAGAPQHLPPQAPVPEIVAADAPAPEVGGILAGALPQQIEDEDKAHEESQVEVEVAIEPSPPGMLELNSAVPRLPQFAQASMTVPAGHLESNLEERTPVDDPEAGDSAADLQAVKNIQDDVENLEVEEPHAEGMQ